MKINVTLNNGSLVSLDGDLSVEQIRETITATGLANLGGAPATESVAENGDRNVVFGTATGTTKGL